MKKRKRRTFRPILFLSLLCLAIWMSAGGSASTHAPRTQPSPGPAQSPTSQASAELNRAMDEFKSAAQHLGNSMAKAADENTADTRRQLMSSMSGAIREMSRMMEQAARKLQPSPSPSK